MYNCFYGPEPVINTLNDEGAKKAVAILMCEENPELTFEQALVMGEEFLKYGSNVKIRAKVDGKEYFYLGRNRFIKPGFCCGGCF